MPDPHPMQARYDEEMAKPRFQATKLSIGWAVTHANDAKLNDDGTMSLSMRFPVLVASEHIAPEHQELLVKTAAELLEAHEWEPKPAPEQPEEVDSPTGWLNHYRCPDCKHEWQDEWDCQADDDCPKCGCRHISPYESEEREVIDRDPDYSPPLASSGVVDVRPAGSSGQEAAGVSGARWQRGSPSEIVHDGWQAWHELEDDSDNFNTIGWFAKNIETGEERALHHSRFGFRMTQERFAWLVDNGFPLPPGKGPWLGSEVDARIGGEV